MTKIVVLKSIIEHNIKVINERSGNRPIIAVVKGNAYGLGLEPFVKELYKNGIRFFAVCEIEDIKTIKSFGFSDIKILYLRSTSSFLEIKELISLGAVLTIGSRKAKELVNLVAHYMQTKATVHIKVDTGMGRYGFTSEDFTFKATECLNIEGVYTHFANAFCSKKKTKNQSLFFNQFIGIHKLHDKLIHAENSSALFTMRFPKYTAVRVGSALVGRVPLKKKTGLKHVSRLETEITEIKILKAGQTCGYGSTFKAKKDMRIAILSVGFADGVGLEKIRDRFRFIDVIRYCLLNIKNMFKPVLPIFRIHGKAAPILGHIGMLHTVVDVSEIPCQIGDIASLDANPMYFREGITRVYEN